MVSFVPSRSRTVTDGSWFSTLQAAVNATPSGGVLDLPANTTYTVTDEVTVANPITIRGNGCTVATSTSGCGGLYITGSGVTIRELGFTGPQGTAYVAGEKAIYVAGASVGSPVTDVLIEDCDFQDWGFCAVYSTWLDGFDIHRCNITNVDYAGVLMLSTLNGSITRCEIDTVNGNGASQSYGVAVSKASGAGTTEATHPRSSDIDISFNRVSNVPLWEALDTHAGVRISFRGNVVTGCLHGIVATSIPDTTSTDVLGPHDFLIDGNVIDSGVTDGTYRNGVTVQGTVVSTGTPLDPATGRVSNNIIRGYGNQDVNTYAGVFVNNSQSVQVVNNVVDQCSPYGIMLYHDNRDFLISGNTIVDAWSTDLSTGGYGIRTKSTYNLGTIGANHYGKGSLTGKTYIMQLGISLSSDANSAITLTPQGKSEATSLITDSLGARVSLTGSRGGNAAVASIATALQGTGAFVDNTSA